MNLNAILALSCAIILAACIHQQVKPTKPTLEIKVQADGGFCVDRNNAEKLGAYILELEK